MLDETAPATRRETSKAERRQRIVEATTSLLRESGFGAVSMLQVAERAGVSPATVYNLFETKAAILQQVFDRDLSEYERLVELAPARDALDRHLHGDRYRRGALPRRSRLLSGDGAGRSSRR